MMGTFGHSGARLVASAGLRGVLRAVAQGTRPQGLRASGASGSVEVEGARLQYRSQGSGEPLLLLHGYPLSGDLFRDNRDMLSRRFRVITMDLRGFGQSATSGAEPGSVATYARDAIALMDALGVQGAVLGGSGLGGQVALEVHRQAAERVRGLVLIATTADPAGTVERSLWAGMAQQVQERGPASLVPELMKDLLTGRSQRARPALVRFLEGMIRSASVAGGVAGAHALAGRPDSRPTLAGVNVPTLIVAGGEDTVYPPVHSERIQEGIEGAELVVVPGASHAVVIEAAPTVNRVILGWAAERVKPPR